jgi:hypothetical protein
MTYSDQSEATLRVSQTILAHPTRQNSSVTDAEEAAEQARLLHQEVLLTEAIGGSLAEHTEQVLECIPVLCARSGSLADRSDRFYWSKASSLQMFVSNCSSRCSMKCNAALSVASSCARRAYISRFQETLCLAERSSTRPDSNDTSVSLASLLRACQDAYI